MEKYLLQTLLSEYRRQLAAALEQAQGDLRYLVIPTRERTWLYPHPGSGPPTEDSPPEDWHWEESFPTHPALTELESVLVRFSDFIDGLETEKAEDGE